MSTECLSEATILEFVQGQLRGESRGRAEGHLAACDECRVLVSALARSSLVDPGEIASPQGTMLGLGEPLPLARTVTSDRAPQPRELGPSAHRARGSEPPVAPGAVLAGKYRVERVLAAGGMGVVVVATHLSLNQPVALKFLRPAAYDAPGSVVRLLREARAAAQIKSEHVARVMDVGTLESGAPYLVMELLEGSDLAQLVRRRGAVSVDVAVDYVLQAGEALAEAHVRGIVHRDLKPANLFLTSRADGSPLVKVLDFGISKVDAHSTLAGITGREVMMGSPRYMSPEQMQNARDVDARADVWALGAILYELVTGVAAFDAESMADLFTLIATAPAPSARARRPEIPAGIDAVIRACLEKRPGDRPESIAELAEKLRPFASPRSIVSIERIQGVLGRRASSVPVSRGARSVEPTGGAGRLVVPTPPRLPSPQSFGSATADAFGGTSPVEAATSRVALGLGVVVVALLVVGGLWVARVRASAASPASATIEAQPPPASLAASAAPRPATPASVAPPSPLSAPSSSAASLPVLAVASSSAAPPRPRAPKPRAAVHVTPPAGSPSASLDTHLSGLVDRK